MRKKIFSSLFLLAFSVLLAATLLFLWIGYRQTTEENMQGLKNQAQLLMVLDEQGKLDYSNLSRAKINDRITVLKPDGTVLFDNYANAAEMENHLQRDEVRQAMQGEEAFAMRTSSTLNTEVIYYAVQLPNGNVIRFARTNDIIYRQFVDVIGYSLVAVLLLLVSTFFAARRITAKVIKPLEALDLEQPKVEAGYPELRPILHRLASQQQMRREFSANVSHELKTPLQSVMGYSEIMLNGLVRDEDKPRFLQKIYDEAKNLLQLIDDIIRLSKLDEQQKNITETFDLRKAIENAMTRLQDKAAKNNVAVHFECQPAKAEILGVQAIIEEVFANLLDNAIKYNHEGGKVSIKLEEGIRRWTVTVTDTGIGIDTSEQDRIFERFYRVDKSRHLEGTGLGLSIVKHGIMIHKGSIKINSRLGEGTQFVIRLPKK